ncbi:cupin domain-containing protein [Algihabitans albus]|uniref:cupin domain-containing protein n=1 Tax=Algihabitans albus TaxID=2164067 RepID=UPI0035D0E3F4
MPVLRKADRYIEEYDRPACGPVRGEWLTPTGTLTQFGAVIETLPPGSRSSIKHWHAEEDEFVLALEGEVTLVEGAEVHILHPGDAATFRAGVPVGHCLENRTTVPCRYLVVGTRAAQEVATYPDHNRIAIMRADSDETIWTDLDRAPADNPYRRAYDDRD